MPLNAACCKEKKKTILTRRKAVLAHCYDRTEYLRGKEPYVTTEYMTVISQVRSASDIIYDSNTQNEELCCEMHFGRGVSAIACFFFFF